MRVRNLYSELKFSFNHKIQQLGFQEKQTDVATLTIGITQTGSTAMCSRFFF